MIKHDESDREARELIYNTLKEKWEDGNAKYIQTWWGDSAYPFGQVCGTNMCITQAKYETERFRNWEEEGDRVREFAAEVANNPLIPDMSEDADFYGEPGEEFIAKTKFDDFWNEFERLQIEFGHEENQLAGDYEDDVEGYIADKSY